MVKAIKSSRPQAVTANRLADGAVVFLTAAGAWSENAGDSAVAADAAAAADLLRAAEAAERGNHVVHPYLIEIEAGGGAPVPVRYREKIRAAGPSISFGADAGTSPRNGD